MSNVINKIKPRTVSAEFEQVLWYADGPQVVLLRVQGGSFIIGVAVEKVWENGAFFGSRISPNFLEEYLRNRFDLRFVLAYPDRRKHYTFDLPLLGEKVTIKSFDFDDVKHECLLPDHRLFASDHTEEYALDGTSFSFVQRYMVDGKWEVSEFSKFHRNLSDLYALSRSVESFEDESIPIDQRRKIMDSFVQPWRGGGSYVSFFQEITRSGGRQNKPVVDAIQWASPGHMDILGDQASFERISRLLTHYNSNKTKIDRAYDAFWKYLSERRLLKASRRSFDKNGPTADLVNERAKAFSKVLGLTSYRTLKKLSGNDPLIASKVLLASTRRLEKMHLFFLEGRIAVEGSAIG